MNQRSIGIPGRNTGALFRLPHEMACPLWAVGETVDPRYIVRCRGAAWVAAIAGYMVKQQFFQLLDAVRRLVVSVGVLGNGVKIEKLIHRGQIDQAVMAAGRHVSAVFPGSRNKSGTREAASSMERFPIAPESPSISP